MIRRLAALAGGALSTAGAYLEVWAEVPPPPPDASPTLDDLVSCRTCQDRYVLTERQLAGFVRRAQLGERVDVLRLEADTMYRVAAE